MADLKDLVQFALDKQPSKFKDAFGELVSQRVVDKVEELKGEISANMFGEAPESDDEEDMIDDIEDEDDVPFDDEDLDDVLADDEDLDGLIDFDLDDEDMPEDEEEELNFDDEDEDEFEEETDEDDESFNEERVEALEEDTTHRLDPMEVRDGSGGTRSIGVRDKTSNRITGYVHVGPKVDSSGKKSMFGNHHKMTYARIGRGPGLDNHEHDLGVRKFSTKDLESSVTDIHAKVGR